jgi:hypothetical protein
MIIIESPKASSRNLGELFEKVIIGGKYPDTIFQFLKNQYDTGRRRGAVETRSAHTLLGTVKHLYTSTLVHILYTNVHLFHEYWRQPGLSIGFVSKQS